MYFERSEAEEEQLQMNEASAREGQAHTRWRLVCAEARASALILYCKATWTGSDYCTTHLDSGATPDYC